MCVCAVKTLILHTGILCPGLSRGRTGLSQAYGIAGHHPKLVLHPGVQAHHCGREHVTIDHLRHCNVEINSSENQAASWLGSYWTMDK